MTNATAIKHHAEPRAPKAMGAAELSRIDDKLVSSLFAEYEKARSTNKKKDLATRIFMELSGHAQVEEDVTNPAAKQALMTETTGVLS